MKSFIFFSAIVPFLSLKAALFAPIGLERQLRGADAVIEGKLLSESPMRTSEDEVITQATFSVSKSVGIAQGELNNTGRLVVFYPGGRWQGVNYHISGGPVFNSKEEVFLILKKGKFGYTLNNFSLGKYLIQNENGEKYLISSVFPEHAELGHLSYLEVEKQIGKVFGPVVSEQNPDGISLTAPINEDAKRGPASLKEKNFAPEKTNRNTVGGWLAFLFALLGLFSMWFARRVR